MGALTAARNTPQMGARAVIEELSLPVKASSKIYQGGLVAIDTTGYAVAASAALNLVIVGIAEKTADNSSGSNGDIQVAVRQGIFKLTNSTSTDAIAATNLRGDCYAVYDNQVALTDGGQARSFAGRIVQVDSDGVWVMCGLQVTPSQEGLGPVCLDFNLADIANGSIAKITPKVAGKIRGFAATVLTPATTGSKLSTITPQIGPVGGAYVSVTGGALALTSANMTPLGAEVDASAITALNAFDATQQINLLASATTAFVEGRVALILYLGK